NALAIRTKMLKEKLSQNTNNNEIIQIYKTFNDILYKGILDDDKFADSFAQVITYGLFLARLNRDEKIELDNAKRFIPKNFPLIKSMLSFLDSEKLDELDMDIKYIIKDIINIINHIDIGSLVRELNKISQKDLYGEYIHKDPYIHFYESFLSKYDKDLRKLRGVYYTPTPVVKFIVDSIDLSLKKHLNQEKGLVTALDSEKITLLDFATGTGTFLLEAFRKVYDGVKDEIPSSKSPKFDDFKRYFKKIVKNFKGFELLIAPYVIAHLKISQVFKDEFNFALENTDKKEYEILNIKLTNTLHFDDDKNTHQNIFSQTLILKELSNEFLEAQNVKEKEILIITGNPPYSGASSNKGLYEKEVQVAYKIPMETPNNPTAILKNNKIEKEKNPKWLLDDYVKFIRFAESKIESQEGGIFAFISNNSFLDNPTFRGMRYHLMQSFDTLYILDLHGNTRKKELSPDGSKDENVFDIMQGVSINIFMKNRNSPLGNHTESKEPPCQIYHYDLYGKRKDKYNFLYENSLDSIPWNRLNPKPPFFLFIPQNESLREEYDKGISVKDMFRISSVGVVGGRDKFVMSESDSQKSLQDFKNRIKRFLELDIESARKEFYLGQDSRDWKVEYAQKELKNTGNNPNNYVKIHYRPFDYRWTYYTGKSKGFHCMPRGEVMEHFLQDSMSLRGEAKESGNMGLSIARQLKDTKIEWNHCMMTQHITDQALTTGGNGPNTIFPLHISNTKSAQKNPKKNAKNTQENGLFSDEDLANDIFKGKERIENFTPEFRSFVDSKYTWDSKDIKANPHLFLDSHTLTPEAILGYLYAVLFHKGYREKYLDFLKIDFPKIPFVESKEKFIALSKLGLELMSVHLMADNERERENRNQ
uniref:type ISP restriction/modification enzyme n=1 Tax=Campylobacter avium TaxID=522485 RepID=UPI00248AC6DD